MRVGQRVLTTTSTTFNSIDPGRREKKKVKIRICFYRTGQSVTFSPSDAIHFFYLPKSIEFLQRRIAHPFVKIKIPKRLFFFFFSTDWASLKMRKTLRTSLTLSTSVLLLLLLLLPCTQEINIDAIAELDFFPIFILSLITFCSLSLSRVSPPRPGLSFLALVCSCV